MLLALTANLIFLIHILNPSETRMNHLSEWDNATIEERRMFLKGTVINKNMDVEGFIDKKSMKCLSRISGD